LASKRIPSGQLQSATGDKRPGSNLKTVKTVEEKKELVSLFFFLGAGETWLMYLARHVVG
jgi:hypothetical protein